MLLSIFLATTTIHNLKYLKITHMCLMWEQKLANLDF